MPIILSQIAKIIVTAWQTAYLEIIDPEYPKNLKLEKYINKFEKAYFCF